MIAETYFQVEFYSRLEERWVALFAKEKTEADARRKLDELLPREQGRVVKVTLTKEVMNANQNPRRNDW